MADQEIEVQAVVDDSPMSLFQWTLLALCFLIAVLDGMDVAIIGSLAPSIRSDWGLSATQLSQIFGAGLLGLSLGAVCLGTLADGYGRRPTLIFGVIGFGLATLACAFAQTHAVLVVCRFVAGLFLGGSLPAAFAILSEYMPKRVRFITLMAFSCGISLGGALSGVVASQFMAASATWREIFIFCGAAPLLLLPLIFVLVPESASFLIDRDRGHERIARVLGRIVPNMQLAGAKFVVPTTKVVGLRLAALFAPHLRNVTLLMWAGKFMAMVVYYFLSSWLPTVIHSGGSSLQSAILLTAMFPLGSAVGAVVLGYAMDRLDPYRVLFFALLLATLCIFLIGQFHTNLGLLAVTISGAGFGIGASIIGLGAIAASIYPPAIRATGVSWATSVSRTGSIAGSMLGAPFVALNLGMDGIFASIAVPALIAALCMFAMGRQAAKHLSPRQV